MRYRVPVPKKPQPWYLRDDGKRLASDQLAIAESYPGLTFRTDVHKRRCYLEGEIVHISPCGTPTRIQIRLEFSRGYPDQEPLVYETGHHFPHIADRHFYCTGRCCLWIDEESTWLTDQQQSLKNFLDGVVVFFDRQIVYDSMPVSERRWPGGERGHGILGYFQYALELVGGNVALLFQLLPMTKGGHGRLRNKACPCGSTIKFKRCHLHTVENIARSIKPSHLQWLMQGIKEAGLAL